MKKKTILLILTVITGFIGMFLVWTYASWQVCVGVIFLAISHNIEKHGGK
jgi:VIT1/CCC1 family predicted Fe2+/Mn2+ transporter